MLFGFLSNYMATILVELDFEQALAIVEVDTIVQCTAQSGLVLPAATPHTHRIPRAHS